MNENTNIDKKKSPTDNIVYLKNVRNNKRKNMKKVVKETKWSKSLWYCNSWAFAACISTFSPRI